MWTRLGRDALGDHRHLNRPAKFLLDLGIELGCAWAVPGKWVRAKELGFGKIRELMPADVDVDV